MKNGPNCFRTIAQIWYYTLNIAAVNRKAEGALEYAVISVPIGQNIERTPHPVMGYRFARQRFEYDSITSEILMKGVGKDMVTSCRGNRKSPRDNLGDLEFGTPTGNRTPVTAVKGRCPNR